MTTIDQTEDLTFQCRHIFTDGHRCGSPALRQQEFCYYHHTSRAPIQNPATRKRRQSRFGLPNPEDRSSIQHSIGEVLRRIATNEVDPRRAGLLLYGLQIASLNLGKHTPTRPDDTVGEITLDPVHGPIAPPAEFIPASARTSSSIERLLEELEPLDE